MCVSKLLKEKFKTVVKINLHHLNDNMIKLSIPRSKV